LKCRALTSWFLMSKNYAIKCYLDLKVHIELENI